MDLAVFPDEEDEDEAGLDLLPVVGRVRLLPRVFLCPFYGVACFLFSAALSSLASFAPRVLLVLGLGNLATSIRDYTVHTYGRHAA